MFRNMLVGISGATCSGKTTLSHLLGKLFHNSRVYRQDDFYYADDDPHHIRDKKTGFINWEIPTAFNMEKLVRELETNGDIKEQHRFPNLRTNWQAHEVFDSDLSFDENFLNQVEQLKEAPLVFVEGILVLNDRKINSLCDIRIFIELDKETCWQRRRNRTYDPQDQIGYFEGLAWPYYLHNLGHLRTIESHVQYLDGARSFQANFCAILNLLCQNMTTQLPPTYGQSLEK